MTTNLFPTEDENTQQAISAIFARKHIDIVSRLPTLRLHMDIHFFLICVPALFVVSVSSISDFPN